MIGEVDGYTECSSTEENNGNKYFCINASTDKNKKVLEKFWDKIKYHIHTINASKSSEYEKKLYENQI